MNTQAGIVRHTHNGRVIGLYGRQADAETMEARMVKAARARQLAARDALGIPRSRPAGEVR